MYDGQHAGIICQAVLLSNNDYEDVDKDKYKDKDEIESSETFSKLSTFTLRAPVEQ